MSGGSYDYAYCKLDEMAESVRARDNHRVTRERVAALIRKLSKIMHDIEWIDSGDYGDEDWADVKKQLDEIGEFNEEARKSVETMLLVMFREIGALVFRSEIGKE